MHCITLSNNCHGKVREGSQSYSQTPEELQVSVCETVIRTDERVCRTQQVKCSDAWNIHQEWMAFLAGNVGWRTHFLTATTTTTTADKCSGLMIVIRFEEKIWVLFVLIQTHCSLFSALRESRVTGTEKKIGIVRRAGTDCEPAFHDDYENWREKEHHDRHHDDRHHEEDDDDDDDDELAAGRHLIFPSLLSFPSTPSLLSFYSTQGLHKSWRKKFSSVLSSLCLRSQASGVAEN